MKTIVHEIVPGKREVHRFWYAGNNYTVTGHPCITSDAAPRVQLVANMVDGLAQASVMLDLGDSPQYDLLVRAARRLHY